jgi:hypothetical protein
MRSARIGSTQRRRGLAVAPRGRQLEAYCLVQMDEWPPRRDGGEVSQAIYGADADRARRGRCLGSESKHGERPGLVGEKVP